MIGPQTTSDALSASAQVSSFRGYFHGFELNPPSSGYATLTVYDSKDSNTSGKKVLTKASCAAGNNSIYCEFVSPRVAGSGIYVVLTGTATYVIGYSLG